VSHQKYFPVEKSGGGLEPRFLAVFDRPDDADLEAIRRGAERVVRARLADARFFWENDRRKRLDERIADLKVQTFHDKLGDYLLKTERLTELAGFIAAELRLPAPQVEKARRAAGLSKADLTTNMVYEFPRLQGTMGMIYAQADGVDDDVARAVGEQYLLEPGPATVLGSVLSLADRFDNIVGYFALGEVPTSSGDPHGLRRQALAALETIDALGGDSSIERPLLLSSVIGEAARLHGFVRKDGSADPDAYAGADLDEFLRDRIYHHLSRETSCAPELIRAVLAAGFDDAHDLKKRLAAVIELSGTPHWEKLAELVERTFKIGRGAELSGDVNEGLLEEAQEKEVWKVLNEVKSDIQALFDSGEYRKGSDLYRERLAGPVHKFFDEVFVNVENQDLRNNRMLLMKQVYDLYAANVADLSLVPGGS
jgi:glycyl-tRNA synthetase beta chain